VVPIPNILQQNVPIMIVLLFYDFVNILGVFSLFFLINITILLKNGIY